MRTTGWLLSLLLMVATAAAFRTWRGADEAGVRLVVDISASELYVVADGKTVKTYPVSAGTREHPTPRGEFTIDKVIWNPAWVPPPNAEWAKDATRKAPGDPDNPMKTAKIFFKEPDYYIHGTDELDKLGEPASHGCIRMRPWHVAEVAKLVMEHGGESRPQSWYNARIEGNETVTVTLPDAIPIRVRA
jgi:lipoprotein-anchoring transpeptidase ErfK/SrfK